jgi:hypothetical protein
MIIGNSVIKPSGFRLDDGCSIPVRNGQSKQTGFGLHLALTVKGKGDILSPEPNQRTHEGNYSPPSSAKIENTWC